MRMSLCVELEMNDMESTQPLGTRFSGCQSKELNSTINKTSLECDMHYGKLTRTQLN